MGVLCFSASRPPASRQTLKALKDLAMEIIFEVSVSGPGIMNRPGEHDRGRRQWVLKCRADSQPRLELAEGIIVCIIAHI